MMPSARINLTEIPAVEVQKLSRTFLSAVKRFYDDPRHVRDFEDWKRQREQQTSNPKK